MSHKNQFAHVLKHGLAKPNRFQILIPLPRGLQQGVDGGRSDIFGRVRDRVSSVIGERAFDIGADALRVVGSIYGLGSSEVTRGLDYMIEQTELPGKNLVTTDIRYNGDYYKLPYGVVYGAQNFTFRVSRDMHEKNIIDDWMNLIFDPNRHEVGYMDDYAVDIHISQLDEQDNIVYTTVMKDAFPSMVNPLTVSNEERDQWHRLSVQFMYRKWIREGEDSGNTSVGSLSRTPFGPLVTPILSHPAVQKGLEVFERNTGIDLEGEAVAIYDQVDSIVKNTTGQSINKSVSLIESIRATTEGNNKLTSDQQGKILDIIDDTLSGLRS